MEGTGGCTFFFFLLGQASQQFVEPPADPAIYPTCGTTFQSRPGEKSRRESTTPLLPPRIPCPFCIFAIRRGIWKVRRRPAAPRAMDVCLLLLLLLTAAVYGLLSLPFRGPYPTHHKKDMPTTAKHPTSRLCCMNSSGKLSLVLVSISNFLGVAQEGGNNAHANTILSVAAFPEHTQYTLPNAVPRRCSAMLPYLAVLLTCSIKRQEQHKYDFICRAAVGHGTGLTAASIDVDRRRS